MNKLTCLFISILVSWGCSEKDQRNEEVSTSAEYSGRRFESEKLTYGVDTLSDNLKNPWSIAFLPDGRMLVTERAGEILFFENDKQLELSFKVPDVFVHGQGGLMDVALHPDYEHNGWIYLSYAKQGEGGGGTVIARTKLEGDQFAPFEELFAAEPLSASGVHFGSRIAFDGAGYMFFSSGERGSKENAQKLSNHLGKILRLHDDGRIPDDNPFIDSVGARPEIWSYGHRNPQGLVYDQDSKILWTVEHGPRGGDELNRVEKGKNYGWPLVTYGINYDGTPIADKQQQEGLEDPVTYWDPSIAPCGMMLVTGTRYKGWENNLLIGALTLKHITRIELADGAYVAQEKLLDQVARIRAVEESPEGYIYVATEGPGMLLKLLPLEKE